MIISSTFTLKAFDTMLDLLEDYKDLSYFIDYIQDDDKEEVRDFLIKHFYTNEPVTKSIGLEISERMKKTALKKIGIGYSLKAVSKLSGKIIGIRLCDMVNRGVVETIPEDLNEKELSLLTFDAAVYKGCDVFEMFPEIDTFLEGKSICVDPEFYGLGIGSHLIDKILDLMIEKKIPLIRELCSNAFSIRIMKQRGFRELNRINYVDYKDRNGNQMFFPEKPHNCCICFIKTLKDLEEERQQKQNQ